MQKISYRQLLNTCSPAQRELLQGMMSVLSELNRDFHDFKGYLPNASLYERALGQGMSPQVAEGLSARLRQIRLSPQDLLARGFDFSQELVNPLDVIEVELPDRPLVYLLGMDIYLDPREPQHRYTS